ncbi:MAG: alpha/beta fold hydrolase [Anaerolineae bacterium]|nr:alpha/beta fold hydrolase [Anaerolineae bacterium]
MSFRRSLRWFFWLLGLIVGLVTAIAFAFAKRLVNPPRIPLWATPGDLGLDYDEIQFPAQDGVRISGWFVPAAADSTRKGATIVLIHGWPWNRLGEVADDLFSELTGRKPVDLLRLAFSLHQDGYNVLMYDMRNHGESAAAPPIAFGQEEAKDLLGALAYLNVRSDVDSARIGVIGFSMGANSLLYALPQTDKISAGIAVQPMTVSVYSQRYGRDLLGLLSTAVLPLSEFMFQVAGGLYFSAYRPSFAAAGAGNTPVLFIQGNGDPWGDAEDVAQMAEATPNSRGPLFVEASTRFEGYQYLIDNPMIATAFFEQELPE